MQVIAMVAMALSLSRASIAATVAGWTLLSLLLPSAAAVLLALLLSAALEAGWLLLAAWICASSLSNSRRTI